MDAVVFPGQGSQAPGMGQPWAGTPSWAVVGTISDVLGRDVGALLLDADAPTLQMTRNAQVAAFALGAVIMDAARGAGMEWQAAAGHSLGEYTAATAAGALTLEDATRLVGARADAMQSAADQCPGTMAAVLGLDLDTVAGCCDLTGSWVANDNAPGQVVVAGTPEGVEAAAEAARGKGGKVRALAVGGAFHTPLMASAQAPLDAAIHAVSIHDTTIPVVANVDAAPHQTAADWPALLGAQLCSPVRWRESVERLAALGVTRVIELGPGAVLGGMVKRIAPDVARVCVSSPADMDGALAAG